MSGIPSIYKRDTYPSSRFLTDKCVSSDIVALDGNESKADLMSFLAIRLSRVMINSWSGILMHPLGKSIEQCRPSHPVNSLNIQGIVLWPACFLSFSLGYSLRIHSHLGSIAGGNAYDWAVSQFSSFKSKYKSCAICMEMSCSCLCTMAC